MRTHRVTRPALLALQVIALAGWALGHWSFRVAVCTVLVHLGLLAYGSFVPQAGFFIRHRNNGEAGTLALTYDDGPVPHHTAALLDLLRTEGVQATFFCIGHRVLREPELARRIVAEGHTIAVHTMDHSPWWGFLSRQAALRQITDCAAAIERTTGTAPKLFRPPYGVTSPATAWAIQQSGLEPVAWDLRTFDTTMGARKHRYARILRRLRQATIVLMHDPVPAALPLTRAIIQQARENGTRLVPL